jgi:hypothetical protein
MVNIIKSFTTLLSRLGAKRIALYTRVAGHRIESRLPTNPASPHHIQLS